ncbi:MAG: pyridoxamine 5'-phosphate oxidase [bacterium]
MNIDAIREEYKYSALRKSQIAENPFEQFDTWLNEAVKAELSYPTAMTFSCFGTSGFPESRIVLLKFFDEEGFVFFTNYSSNKAKSIEKNPVAGLQFFWPELERQVRITGYTTKTSAEISNRYFKNRPEKSRIAAWASNQSAEIPSRKYLEEQFGKYSKKFRNKEIPRPDFWGGYVVKPIKLEFWQGRENRLHDRIIYEKENDKWNIKRLAP